MYFYETFVTIVQAFVLPCFVVAFVGTLSTRGRRGTRPLN